MSDEVIAVAQKVLDAMHEFFEVAKSDQPVRWIEDDQGRVLIFTKGDYRDEILRCVQGLADVKKEEVHYFTTGDKEDG